ncbi:hypothetical protein BGZ49_002378, partial [Haplosporangium sp. Z 27]
MDSKYTPVTGASSRQQQQKPLHSVLSGLKNSRRQSNFTVRFAESPPPSPIPKSPLRPSTPRPKLTKLSIPDNPFDFKLLDGFIYDYDDDSENDKSSSFGESVLQAQGLLMDSNNNISQKNEPDDRLDDGSEGEATEQTENHHYAQKIDSSISNSLSDDIRYDLTPSESTFLAESKGNLTFDLEKSDPDFNLVKTISPEFQPRTPLSAAPSNSPPAMSLQSTEFLSGPSSVPPSPSLPLGPICANTTISFAASRLFHRSGTSKKIKPSRLFKPASSRFTKAQVSPQASPQASPWNLPESLSLISHSKSKARELNLSRPSASVEDYLTFPTERYGEDLIVGDSEVDTTSRNSEGHGWDRVLNTKEDFTPETSPKITAIVGQTTPRRQNAAPYQVPEG